MDCPFCKLPYERIVAADNLSFAIRDAYPVSLGHTLVIPKRHVPSFFEISEEELKSIMHILQTEKQRISNEHNPDAFNVGINDGFAAGQTIPHLHIHLIPRYKGDKLDPRGGIRWIFPEKAKYWK